MIGIWFPIAGGKFALVDRQYYDEVILYKWHQSGLYVSRHLEENKSKETLHQFIIYKRVSFYYGVIDHKNTDKFDCREENLRLSNSSQNTANSKPKEDKYKGVQQYNKNCYRSRIMIHGREITLGSYYNKEEAANAYDNAAIIFFGEFANLNCSWLNK